MSFPSVNIYRVVNFYKIKILRGKTGPCVANVANPMGAISLSGPHF